MAENTKGQNEVDRFLISRIDSVPHLEALLLVWRCRPNTWTLNELAERLYVKSESARSIVADLIREELIALVDGPAERYGYASKSERQDVLMKDVEEAYRRELIRISNLIHSKAPASVREFARAFRFMKQRQ